jgi:hypothetical protein
MGDKSLAFVENSLTVARNHPEALPANFDYLEFNRDVGLMEGLIEVEMELDKLRAEVNDTKTAVCSEAIVHSANLYRFIKASAATIPGLKSVVQQLGARFAKSGHAPLENSEKK